MRGSLGRPDRESGSLGDETLVLVLVKEETGPKGSGNSVTTGRQGESNPGEAGTLGLNPKGCELGSGLEGGSDQPVQCQDVRGHVGNGSPRG